MQLLRHLKPALIREGQVWRVSRNQKYSRYDCQLVDIWFSFCLLKGWSPQQLGWGLSPQGTQTSCFHNLIEVRRCSTGSGEDKGMRRGLCLWNCFKLQRFISFSDHNSQHPQWFRFQTKHCCFYIFITKPRHYNDDIMHPFTTGHN